MNIQELDQKAKRLAKHYIRLEKELLGVIMEVDRRKAFYKLGYSSLHQYVLEGLNLSSGQAVPFVNVARKAIEVPELKTEVENGLSIYKAQKMTSVLTKENHNQWFKAAKEKTHRQLEREVALASPRRPLPTTTQYLPLGVEVPDKVSYKTSVACLYLQMSIPEKTMLLIRRVEDLECQRQKRKVELDEVLEILANTYLDKNDPVRKAKRQKAKGKLNDEIKSEEKNESMDEDNPNTKNNSKDSDGFTGENEILKTENSETQTKRIVKNTGVSTPKSASELSSNLSRDKSNSTEKSVSLRGAGNEATKIEDKHDLFSACLSQDLQNESISYSKTKQSRSHVQSRNDLSRDKTSGVSKIRQPLNAKLTHQVQLRDEGQCTYKKSDGKRCTHRRFLEIHHVIPVAMGGNNHLDNLTLLCAGHHKVIHA